jgi:hypothetical protein
MQEREKEGGSNILFMIVPKIQLGSEIICSGNEINQVAKRQIEHTIKGEISNTPLRCKDY